MSRRSNGDPDAWNPGNHRCYLGATPEANPGSRPGECSALSRLGPYTSPCLTCRRSSLLFAQTIGLQPQFAIYLKARAVSLLNDIERSGKKLNWTRVKGGAVSALKQ